MTIRVLLVDDHELVRQGVASMLAKAEDLTVVGEAKTGREAIETARKELPDVVLMDVRMPDMDGLEATRRIKEERSRTAVIMVTMHDNPAYLREAVRAGAAGYLLKDVSKDDLIDAIRQVATGGAFIESQMLKGMLSEMKPGSATPSAARNLTKREREILALVAEGLSNREIADKLVLSPETVKSHVAAILEKRNVSDRTQAAIYAVRHGLVEVSPGGVAPLARAPQPAARGREDAGRFERQPPGSPWQRRDSFPSHPWRPGCLRDRADGVVRRPSALHRAASLPRRRTSAPPCARPTRRTCSDPR